MLALVTLLMLSGIQPAALSKEDPWAQAAKKDRTPLVLVTDEGDVHKGQLLHWSEDAISVETPRGNILVPRESVAIVRAADSLGSFHTVYAPWENLGHLVVDDQIRVVKTNLVLVDGLLAGFDEDEIKILQRGKQVSIPRAKIQKVRVLYKSHKEIGEQIGGSITFFAILALALAGSSGAGVPDPGQLVDPATAGAMAGGLIGSWFNEYQTVYLSPTRR